MFCIDLCERVTFFATSTLTNNKKALRVKCKIDEEQNVGDMAVRWDRERLSRSK